MKTASRKLILGKLLKKSRSYLPVFILSVVLAVLTVIGTLLAPLFIGQAIDCIVGAGSLVPQGMVIPDGSMAFGSPAKIRRPLTEEEIANNRGTAALYCREAAEYAE